MKKKKSSIGGLIGHVGGKVIIQDCSATGTIAGDLSNSNVGGLIGSCDSGSNIEVINSSSDMEIKSSDEAMFRDLRDSIQQELHSNADIEFILDLVDQLSEKKGKLGYLESYTQFISSMADHMSLVTPFFSFLTGFIPK